MRRSFQRWLVVFIGAIHSGSAMLTQAMNPDGMCYLDMGDALFAGDWSAGLTSVWSPLYALVLGLALELTDPGLRWEFVVVHAVNFGIFCFALAGFEFLWSRVLSGREGGGGPPPESAIRFDWWLLGYALFATITLWLVPLRLVTPDLLTSGLIYFAGGLLLEARRRPAPAKTLALLGVVLGLAYLAKSVMFPLGVLLIVTLFLPGGQTRISPSRVAAVSLGFLLIASPWILTLSVDRGRPTFGDAGRLTYAWRVNGVPFPQWHGDDAHGQPLNPSRILHRDPPVFEFADPVGGTYPMIYDSAYWYEGVETRLRWGDQLGALGRGIWASTVILTQRLGVVFFLLGLIYLLAPARTRFRRFDLSLPLVAGAAFGAYALVLVESRYVGAFTLLLAVGLIDNLPTEFPRRTRRAIRPILWTVLASLGILLGGVTLLRVAEAFDVSPVPKAATELGSPASGPAWRAASALEEAGIRRGDRVGVIGYSGGSFWARLAGVRIVAEVPATAVTRFWASGVERQGQVLAAFREAGVSAVVAEPVAGVSPGPGWRSLGDTGLLFRTTSN